MNVQSGPASHSSAAGSWEGGPGDEDIQKTRKLELGRWHSWRIPLNEHVYFQERNIKGISFQSISEKT